MQRKQYATTITVILCACLFIVIGSCFSTFLYQKELIRVENPKVVASSNISVFKEDGQTQLEKLELSKLNLGLKPTTGEEDAITSIPSTVTDRQGSEGHYAKFKLLAASGANVSVTNVVVQTKHDQEKVNEQRKNIMVAIDGVTKEAVSLEQDIVNLGTIEASEQVKEYTFYVWLSAKTSDDLEGATISFDISFADII